MRFVQVGNTRQCEINGMRDREYWFAKSPLQSRDNWEVKSKSGNWSIGTSYRLSFYLELKY